MIGIFGTLGLPEILIVLFVVLLLFGNRLPNVARSLAEGIVEFKKGLKGEKEKEAIPPPKEEEQKALPKDENHKNENN